MTVLSPSDELERFLATSASSFSALIMRIARAMIDDRMSPEKALDALSRRVTETMTLAHIYGQRRVLLEVDAAAGGRAWATEEPQAGTLATARFSALIPQVPFAEAVTDLLTREPRLGSTWREIADLYQSSHVFAAVRSANLQVTERVGKAVADILAGGQKLGTATSIIRDLTGWSEAYAETVFRTNAATAYSQGRQAEAVKPLVRKRMPAWEFFTADDVDVRFNHAKVHGLLAETTDPIWEIAMPPLGYNCRCSIRLVSIEELDERGQRFPDGRIVPIYPASLSTFQPDPGFERKTVGLVG